MPIKQFYAHSKEDMPPEERQRLEGHTKNIAELARLFDRAFGVNDWDYLPIFWNDLITSSGLMKVDEYSFFYE